jgi:hypothetical protein
MKKTFKVSGTFESYYAACKWLSENGYSYGSMQGDAPIGIMKGEWNISKWRNMTSKEQKSLDGVMTGEFREGEVVVSIK